MFDAPLFDDLRKVISCTQCVIANELALGALLLEYLIL
jgi:hypothetical protein